MAIKGSMRTDGPIKAKINTGSTLNAKTIMVSSTQRFTDLSDVDSTLLDDGAVVIYDLETQTFKLKNEMNNSNTKIIGGSF